MEEENPGPAAWATVQAASAAVLHDLWLEAIVAIDPDRIVHVVKTTYPHYADIERADTECGSLKLPMLRFFWSVDGPRSIEVPGSKRCKMCFQISAARAARRI